MEYKNKVQKEKLPSSFRDPSGFLFLKQGIFYRQINLLYKHHYDHLIKSGLLDFLVKRGLLIPHKEAGLDEKFCDGAYKIIQPEKIPFISYPYEWCFDQLKDAAMATLQIQKYALDFGMVLKDASAYNIQFLRGKPLLIDTLSFEKYKEGEPWVAYRQFCQHFLAPLALMSCRSVYLGKLLQVHIDGIPLELASSLLPWSSFLRPFLFAHIHLHAKVQSHMEKRNNNPELYFLGKKRMLALIENLFSLVSSLKWNPQKTEWADYYNETNYSKESFEHKKKIIKSFLSYIKPQQVWDIGANTGIFSRIASSNNIYTVSFDIDPATVEKNYIEAKKNQEKNILPLILDILNPSPALGWQNTERDSLQNRGPTDCIFALALIHHLVITGNISFESIAEYFNKIGNSLIVEFAPKEDSQVQRMLSLSTRTFPDYSQEDFEKALKKYFMLKEKKLIPGSERFLYFMKKL